MVSALVVHHGGSGLIPAQEFFSKEETPFALDPDYKDASSIHE